MEATVPSADVKSAVPQIQLGNLLQIPAVRQVMLLVGVAVAVAAAVAVVLWSQTPDYSHRVRGVAGDGRHTRACRSGAQCAHATRRAGSAADGFRRYGDGW